MQKYSVFIIRQQENIWSLTRRFRIILSDFYPHCEVKNKMLSDIPLGSFGETEDIAGTVLFLSLDDARYITGQVISVDGGMSI